MMDITEREMLERLDSILKEEEKSEATREKYLRDTKTFLHFIGENGEITKERVIGCQNCTVKAFKVQREAFRSAERDICRLADLLGHANINTTRIYTRISCEEQANRIEGLGLVI